MKETATHQSARPNDELLFNSMLGLIKHLDERIDSIQKFFITAIGSLIPLFILLINKNVHWTVFALMGVLLLMLAVLWVSLSRKLTLNKKFWSEVIREVESRIFPSSAGPFTIQKDSFKDLTKVGILDRFIVRRIGTRRFQAISIIAFIVLILLALFIAILYKLGKPINIF